MAGIMKKEEVDHQPIFLRIFTGTPQLPTVFHTTIFSVFLEYFLDTEKYEVS